MNKTKKQVKPNLQKIKIVENGKVKSVWASARALKNLSVERV
ncbi:50S ribosomal protein L28 [Lactococcus chungangensis CAU 28 = DSM 22330]|nr:50S ribosomal protein L28 [Lactococcus chungangensis CAU 28 = DSM 22330]PCS05150.1 50S ribosomal protein L28 [Lactococcus piscium]